MTDSLTPEKRSWNMSRIHSKDTVIEIKIRKFLFSKGFRYRKNFVNLPGKPDIVLKKYKTVIFVHGCFWHRHENCRKSHLPKSNIDFWKEKIKRNKQRFEEVSRQLEKQGWNVVVIWECEIREHFENTMKKLVETITNQN